MGIIYLIRHGIAEMPREELADSDRRLTDKGIHRTRRVAKRLAKLITCDRLLASPLRRAQETAEILVQAKLASSFDTMDFLKPEGSLEEWLHWYNQQTVAQESDHSDSPEPDSMLQMATVGLVGHQPDLGRWAEQLVWGQFQDKLILRKAGIIGVQLPEEAILQGQGEMLLLLPPRFLL